ncbi:MAG: O-antigen ligase family protein [Clostridiales bacterium]|nr:O-antigen ligase family protein [Clostridiales bacterium]MBE5747632.1 O-antigen ligase family protein [Clostridiales bacterium]
MIEKKKQDNTFFVIAILLLAFSNVFALSGYAYSISYTEIATLLTLVLLLFGIAANSMKRQRVYSIDTLLLVTCLLYGVAMVFSWKSFYQLTNLVTLFGISVWMNAFSKLKWDDKKFAACGVACSVYAVVMIALFLPGSLLSGWNSNSAIAILPVAIFGIACLMMVKAKWKTWAILITIILVSVLILQLENRSAFLAFVIFLLACLFKKLYSNRTAFRIFYITILALNILLPLFFEIASSTKLFKIISNVLLDVFDKSGLNGREEVWAAAVEKFRENPWFGTLGYRTTYFHNFSLDVLTQFGLVGWIIFFAVLIFIFEKSFKENEKSNLFLIGFICLIFLNTFESVLFCNNYFMIFAYLLLGMCWKKETSEK